jgi:hypothetical protein
MTVLSLPTSTFDGRVEHAARWWDAEAEYGRGAERSYRRHGVESALDVDAVRSGVDTAMFMAVVDRHRTVVGGVRAIGPLQSAADSHAVIEWAGQPGEQAVAKLVSDRVPYGVLEMKSAWVAEDAPHTSEIAEALARSGFHMMAMLGLQFCMATAAAYVLNRWRSSGGVVAPIAAAPYPDHRYQTKMMWWDRCNFIRYAAPKQAAKIITEIADLPTADSRSLAFR